MMRKILLAVFAFFPALLMGCGHKHVVKTTPPAWFYEPADVKHPSFVGFSNPTLPPVKPFQLAKERAVRAACSFYLTDCKSALKSLRAGKTPTVAGKKLRFEKAVVRNKNYMTEIYAVDAYFRKKRNYEYAKDCQKPDLSKCRPSWVCNILREGYAASVGIANISNIFFVQFRAALKNAIENFSTMFGVKVSGEQERRILKTPLSAFSLNVENFQISGRKTSKLRFIVRSMFVDKNGKMFVYLESPDIKLAKEDFGCPPCWLKKTSCKGERIYKGYAKQNLFGIKAQLKEAIKRALVRMALEKGVSVDAKTASVKTNGGVWMLQVSNQKLSETVKGQIVGIYFDRKHNLLYVGLKAVGK